MRNQRSICIALTLLIIAGVMLEKRMVRAAALDAGGYHQAVREAGDKLPLRIGLWFGKDTPVPSGALELLHPNCILSRRYTQAQTGRQVSLLLVQCSDARDILGHFPPVCYPAHGWTSLRAVPRDWVVDDLQIHGMEYEFVSGRVGDMSRMVILNFMILPDGRTCRDMAGIDTVAQDRRKRYFGAAQWQLVFDAGIDASDRDSILLEMVQGGRGVVNTICTGVQR